MTTAREVFERLTASIGENRFADLSELYAVDTLVEHPQRPAGLPPVRGRAAVHERFSGALATSLRMKAHDVVVHETTDPEVVVGEYRYGIEGIKTGRTAVTANAQVIRVRDGLIVHSRDYHDYLSLARVRDGVDELVEAYERAVPEVRPVPPRPRLADDPKSPRGVFERLVYGLSGGKRGELAGELYAEPTQVSHPLYPPAPVLRTRQELREHFERARALDVEATNLVTYQSTDPEVIIGEFDYVGTTPTGRPFRLSNMYVMRVRDGQIVESRDYGDHLNLRAATGELKEIATAN